MAMRTLKQWDARFAQRVATDTPAPLSIIAAALFEANACLEDGDMIGLQAYINDMHCAMQAIAPQSKQAQHLAGFIAEARSS